MGGQVQFYFEGETKAGDYAKTATSAGVFVLSTGVEPSTATLQISATETTPIPVLGALTISDGFTVLTFDDCRAAEVVRQYGTTPGSVTVTLTVRDRRWRWGGPFSPKITGTYNRRDATGTLAPADPVKSDRKTARELAVLLLETLGDAPSIGDVEGLPEPTGDDDDAAHPAVEWDATSAASALRDLAERYNCLVCLNTAGVVSIQSRTDGASEPDAKARAKTDREIVRDVPEKIVLHCAPDRIQVEVALEAVAFDPSDGEWKRVDEESTADININGRSVCPNILYRPNNGFHAGIWSELKEEARGTGLDEEKEAYDAAQKTLFKCYRPTAETFAIPNPNDAEENTVTRARLVERILPDLIDEQTTWDGATQKLRPYCIGPHATRVGLSDPASPQTDTDARLEVPISRIDARLGLIWFSAPVFTVDSDEKMVSASLKLICAVRGERPTVEKTVDNGVAGLVEHIVRDDVVFDWRYDTVTESDSWFAMIEAAAENDAAMNAKAEAYLDEALARYANEETGPRTREYTGVVDVSPDGLIEQVSWGVDKGRPPGTTVSWRTEHATDRPLREERNALIETGATVAAQRKAVGTDTKAQLADASAVVAPL